jgi:hypothetical protein
MSRGPGRWQKAIVQRLKAEDGFLLLNGLLDDLQRAPTRAEYSAVFRAAVLLAKQGECTVGRVWGLNAARHRAALVWVCRPGLSIEGKALTAYEERLGVMPPW